MSPSPSMGAIASEVAVLNQRVDETNNVLRAMSRAHGKRLDALQTGQDQINQTIHKGNGQPSLVLRVTRLEDRQASGQHGETASLKVVGIVVGAASAVSVAVIQLLAVAAQVYFGG